MKRKTNLLVVIFVAFLMLTGCGEQGIEGKWVLTKEVLSDGTKMNAKDLADEGIAESYEISGDKAVYTCDVALIGKPITIEFDVKELGNNTYDLQMPGGYVFATVTVDHNTMTYEVGEGDSYSKMYFSRQKQQ
ncbi:MAG: hypothetical protein J6O73_02610 [Lachnospiraceae bacterium]|nr:hypothetical protein [Lachnospiraceae bacterium]